jgi:hypothetical protein
MRYALPVVLAAMLATVGCNALRSDQDRVESSLRSNPFFKSLGATSGGSRQPPTNPCDGDTTWPLGAWRNVHDPDVDYVISVEHPFATVDFHADWPCTLYAVYTDLPDTSIRDTVVKPAPEFHGTISFRFEFTGDSWELRALSPCPATFDSALGLMALDSVEVSVRREGETVPYPTLDNTGLLPLDPYDYTFQPGDSVSLRLWETHAPEVDFPWVYLHGPPGHNYSPFNYDQANGCWYGTWTINPRQESSEARWVWFEMLDVGSALIRKTGPDRSVLWGLPYIVE